MAETLAPILNFIVVVSVFFFGGRKLFLAMLKSRSESVQKEMGEAEAAYSEASKFFNESESNSRNREANAKRELDEAQSSLARLKERTLAAAKTEAERIQREAKMMGSNEVDQAKELLQRELALKSIELTESFFGKQFDAKEKAKLVNEYVELVGNGVS